MRPGNSLLRGAAISLLGFVAAAAAHADCPSPDSVERYVESSRDAVIALSGALPPDQFLDLENRYAANVIMEWELIGIEGIQDDDDALAKLTSCFRDQSCGADGSDAIDRQLTDLVRTGDIQPVAFQETLTNAPSSSMLAWAEIELGCREAQEPEPAPTENLESELVSDPARTADTPSSAQLAAEEIEDSTTASDADQDLAITSVVETDTNLADEMPADIPEQAAPLPEFTASPGELIQTAAAFIASGEIERAIPPLRNACLYETAQTQTSIACDTLLDVYEARTVVGSEEIANSDYLSFSEEICSRGYIQGCENMALYLRAANTDGAYERGVEFTARSCSLGDAGACATLAQDHIEGRTEYQDLAFARETLERSCDLGRLESCREVADLYVRGVGGDPDNTLALRAIALACPEVEARSPDLCVSAADFVLINMKSSAERATRVRSFIKRACDIGHGVGCAWYAEDLELGIGGQVDTNAAREARLTACEYGDKDSCRPRS
ncbi:MAG: hypothetical protein Hens2KO_06690 [Henriciella sp.]